MFGVNKHCKTSNNTVIVHAFKTISLSNLLKSFSREKSKPALQSGWKADVKVGADIYTWYPVLCLASSSYVTLPEGENEKFWGSLDTAILHRAWELCDLTVDMSRNWDIKRIFFFFKGTTETCYLGESNMKNCWNYIKWESPWLSLQAYLPVRWKTQL